jgi:hypothetical protein
MQRVHVPRVVASLLALTLPAQAAVDAGLVGTWQAGAPGQAIVLQVQADGRCALAGRQGQCATQGALMMFQGPEITQIYQWVVAGATLQLSRDAGNAVVFRRVEAGGAAPSAQARATPATPPAAATPATRPPAAPGRGTGHLFQQDAWGVSFTVPLAWRAVEKDGNVLVVSDTEAGLMLVQFVPRTSRAEMLAAYREGLSDGGFMAQPVAEATPFEAAGGSALAGMMEGRAQDGTPLRVRSIGVLSRFGGAVVVMGLTTPQQFAKLQASTEALARSVSFRAPPKAAPIAGQYQYVYVSKVGSYSREASLTLCASGRFTQRGEMSGSGSAGSAISSGGGDGSWSAVGDGMSGTLTLSYSGGGSSSLPYRVSTHPRDRSGWGPAVQFGNDLYQKAGDGNC